MDFALARDRRGRLRFAALQGETFAAAAADLDPGASPAGADTGEGAERAEMAKASEGGRMESMVLWDHRGLHRKSDAALGAIASLGGAWRLAALLRAVPRPLRDFLYDAVARNRYRWFGKRETCRLPGPGERARFLP